MSSNPSWLIIDDYPDEDIPDCAERGSEQYQNQLLNQNEGCSVATASNIFVNVILDQPLICNGNVSPTYWMSYFLESYTQEFEITCDGGSPSRFLSTFGSKYFVREPVGPNEVVPEKNRGLPQCGLSAGNPINIATGNKYHRQVDTTLPGNLEIVRHYNSNDSALHSFGMGWRGSFSRNIDFRYSADYSDVSIAIVRDDGAENYWQLKDMIPVAPPDAAGQLDIAWSNGSIIGFTYISDGNSIETYDANGSLLSIEHDQGQVLLFSYTDSLLAIVATASGRELIYSHLPDGRVSQISSSDGSIWKYFYDVNNNLTQVENPDGSIKTYHYEDIVFLNALTGESDEKGNRVRSWAYDATGRAVLSTHGDSLSSVERNEIVYNIDGSSNTVNPLQNSAHHDFENIHGIARFGSVNNVCTTCDNTIETTTYDSRGNKDIVTDFNDNRTDYDYTLDNLLEKVTYSAGTSDETEISYSWDLAVRKPSEVVRPGQSVSYAYNGRGQVLNRTEKDTSSLATRSWTYTYFEPPSSAPLLGKILSIDGPRTDVIDITGFEYYSTNHPDKDYLVGDLKAITNAIGHRTEYLKYDGAGRPVEIQDTNGVLTSMTYHARGWLESRTTDGKTTVFTYDLTGNLTRVTQPDGSFTDYEYDAVHRLKAIADQFNNRVEYTLDASGNRTSEKTFDRNGVLRHQLSRIYDQLSRLEKLIDGNNDQTLYGYDTNGNRISARDANLNQTTFEYDGLDRLVKTIDAILGETQMGYDARNNLISITDPMENVTHYVYDGLNSQTRLDSPDTGTTQHEFDDAGNRTAVSDARGIRTEYFYDALNRLSNISYPDSSLDVSFIYDVGINGKGRLTRMTDAAGIVDYAYDARGNLLSEMRTIGIAQYLTAYAYNDADRLLQMTYPSGMAIEYTLDAAGRIMTIDKDTGSGAEPLVSGIQYEPFGPVTAFTYGNGLAYSATYDQDYELDQIQSGSGLDWLLGYDPAGNILTITDQANSLNNQAFGYDDQNRLGTAQGAYGDHSIEYDANGNRSRYLSDTVDEPYTYEPQSNRLATQSDWAFTRDAMGNRTSKLNSAGDGQLFSYGEHKRLSQTSIRDSAGDTVVGEYQYDGRGQRASKKVMGTTVHFIYGQSGELLGEYTDGLSEELTEYVYLNGQPIAVSREKTELYQPPGAELILDNGDPGTNRTGKWQTKSNRRDHGSDYLFANKAANRSYRWTTTPPGTSYDVYAWWVSGKSYSSQVAYTIGYGAGETDTVTKSQKSGGGQWQILGSYYSTDGLDYVEVSSPDNKFVADAIRWVQVHEPVITRTATSYFIHSDHLGTPRRVTDQAQTIVWRWDSRPFGDSPANEDPDGDFTKFTLNLRFPGQYYDAESGLHYNYFRTYDPGTGRYLESDPIGLDGGLNVFAYVANAPVQFIDPRGLKVSGEWIKEPRLNLTDLGVTGGKFITPYFSEWSYLKLFRLYGFAAGFVNIDVRCTDTEACDKREWEIHERIGVSYHGYKDVGPSTAAAGAGIGFGPLAGAATSIVTFGGSTLTALLDFLKEVDARGGDKIQWLYHLGPSVICQGTR